MTIAKMLLTEFEQEAKTTRKFLEQLPEDKLLWKPHEKSMTPGQLALHILLLIFHRASRNEIGISPKRISSNFKSPSTLPSARNSATGAATSDDSWIKFPH